MNVYINASKARRNPPILAHFRLSSLLQDLPPNFTPLLAQQEGLQLEGSRCAMRRF
jgi:hypothetical protein